MFITMVMFCGVLISSPLPDPTYSEAAEPVKMVTDNSFNYTMADINKTNTAGTTKEAVVGSPRLVAQPGESQEVIDAIIRHFPNEPVMVEVARCESSLNPLASRRGIDSGLFQINQVHLPRLNELGYDRYNMEHNLLFSRMLYDESGLKPWFMSKHCWGKYISY